MKAGDTIRDGPARQFVQDKAANYVLVAGGLAYLRSYMRQHIARRRRQVSSAVFGYRNVRFGDEYAGKYADKVYSIDEAKAT